ncbi:DUF6528 family protein [Mucilaginibacter boryungensis]|uniref:WD40 repeat protein n=1 Tax=Mucilaginibacter boryungensis TaxID=768480 RepID=A0ABR9XHG2_9SPHI|nr:DUF6528 family protein [Mucilaginibacter boryungensis]MBE9666833.1 hypothetical protein [Mucilaginibacter boryungensis]
MKIEKSLNRPAVKKNAGLIGILAVLIVVVTGCKKEHKIADSGSGQQVKSPNLSIESTTCGCWIGAVNQANNAVEVYDPAVYYWNTAPALKWSFTPTTALGYSSTAEIPLWGGPTDVKLRNVNAFTGTSQAIATAGGRLATIAAYPSGNKIWTMGFSTADPQVEIHSVELLPNGNIALASAGRNWVRVYSSSQPVPNHDHYAEFSLGSAHAVLWDPSINRLWVIGWLPIHSANYWDALNQVITALQVTGTAANPVLTEDTNYRAVLPGKYGHEISPYYYDNNKLWVAVQVDNTDNSKGVYIFDKTTKTFTPVSGAANRNFVKGIGNQPSGQIVEIRPQNAGGTGESSWQNDTVNFYNPAATRIVPGAKFYKIRVFDPDYQ